MRSGLATALEAAREAASRSTGPRRILTAAEIRRQAGRAVPLIVAVTGVARAAADGRIGDLFDGYTFKPIDPHTFTDRIQGILDAGPPVRRVAAGT